MLRLGPRPIDFLLQRGLPRQDEQRIGGQEFGQRLPL